MFPSRTKYHIEEKLLERESKLICVGIRETKEREKWGRATGPEELRNYKAIILKNVVYVIEEEALSSEVRKAVLTHFSLLNV